MYKIVMLHSHFSDNQRCSYWQSKHTANYRTAQCHWMTIIWCHLNDWLLLNKIHSLWWRYSMATRDPVKNTLCFGFRCSFRKRSWRPPFLLSENNHCTTIKIFENLKTSLELIQSYLNFWKKWRWLWICFREFF